jgi:Kef-type K+ transport system membrane component KefB
MQHIDLLGSVGIAISVAAILAFIGNRLRQPLLLAYLLAGVLIGPQIGLGLVSDEASIETVSEIGSGLVGSDLCIRDRQSG